MLRNAQIYIAVRVVEKSCCYKIRGRDGERKKCTKVMNACLRMCSQIDVRYVKRNTVAEEMIVLGRPMDKTVKVSFNVNREKVADQ